MSKHLQAAKPAASGVRTRRHPKALSRRSRAAKVGWTPERRAQQAARARLMKPWRHSTGPRTEAGKARVAKNPLRHGYRSREWILRARRIRAAIRLCRITLLRVRMHRQREVEAARLNAAVLALKASPTGNSAVRFMSLIS